MIQSVPFGREHLQPRKAETMRCFYSDPLAGTPDAMLRKRSASKASLPSPNDPRDEAGAGQGKSEEQGLLSNKDDDSDDGLLDAFKGRGILFQAFSR